MGEAAVRREAGGQDRVGARVPADAGALDAMLADAALVNPPGSPRSTYRLDPATPDDAEAWLAESGTHVHQR